MSKHSMANIIDNDQLPRRNLFFELGIIICLMVPLGFEGSLQKH